MRTLQTLPKIKMHLQIMLLLQISAPYASISVYKFDYPKEILKLGWYSDTSSSSSDDEDSSVMSMLNLQYFTLEIK
jgi:hypothetical protein